MLLQLYRQRRLFLKFDEYFPHVYISRAPINASSAANACIPVQSVERIIEFAVVPVLQPLEKFSPWIGPSGHFLVSGFKACVPDLISFMPVIVLVLVKQ